MTGNSPYMPYSAQISQKQDERNIYVIMKTYMLLCSSYFCEISALCVLWITYDNLYYTPCLSCRALFGLMVPAMCNSTLYMSYTSWLPQNHCIYIYIYIYIYILYTYIYIYIYTIKLYPPLINCSILCTTEWFNWIMLKIQLSFQYSEFHVNYFTIFSLIISQSTDLTKSLQCKGIFLSNVNWRYPWR